MKKLNFLIVMDDIATINYKKRHLPCHDVGDSRAWAWLGVL